MLSNTNVASASVIFWSHPPQGTRSGTVETRCSGEGIGDATGLLSRRRLQEVFSLAHDFGLSLNPDSAHE